MLTLVVLITVYFNGPPEVRVLPDMDSCRMAALIALRSAGPDRVDRTRCVTLSVPLP